MLVVGGCWLQYLSLFVNGQFVGCIFQLEFKVFFFFVQQSLLGVYFKGVYQNFYGGCIWQVEICKSSIGFVSCVEFQSVVVVEVFYWVGSKGLFFVVVDVFYYVKVFFVGKVCVFQVWGVFIKLCVVDQCIYIVICEVKDFGVQFFVKFLVSDQAFGSFGYGQIFCQKDVSIVEWYVVKLYIINFVGEEFVVIVVVVNGELGRLVINVGRSGSGVVFVYIEQYGVVVVYYRYLMLCIRVFFKFVSYGCGYIFIVNIGYDVFVLFGGEGVQLKVMVYIVVEVYDIIIIIVVVDLYES